MMTPLLLQLFRRPWWINTQESCEEIWVQWKKNPKNSALSNILTYRCYCKKLISKLNPCAWSFYHCTGARAFVCSFDVITQSPLDEIYVYHMFTTCQLLFDINFKSRYNGLFVYAQGRSSIWFQIPNCLNSISESAKYSFFSRVHATLPSWPQIYGQL